MTEPIGRSDEADDECQGAVDPNETDLGPEKQRSSIRPVEAKEAEETDERQEAMADDQATLLPDPSTRVPAQTPGSDDPFETFVSQSQLSHESTDRSLAYDALVRGDQVGDFRVLRLLGRGSFGAVYLARELSLDRLVAVKVVLPEGKSATEGEGRSLARLKHPNIVGVYGESEDRQSGCSLLWMQYVDGLNLASLIQKLYMNHSQDWKEGDLLGELSTDTGSDDQSVVQASRGSLETVCRIGAQLARAISHAHQSGITHRDIKPANILMQRDATPLLADFNLSENAHDDLAQKRGGTVAYMPPEQLAMVLGRQEPFGARRADIYSLGVVLWELSSGSRPYADAESRVDTSGGQQLVDFLEVRRNPLSVSDGGVPIGLSMVLCRAMSVDPGDRYPSAKAMANALTGLAQLQRARRRAPVVDGVRQFVQRHLVWVLIGGLLPHLAASLFQSWYNFIWIIRPGGEAFQEAFEKAFIVYNVILYPACVGYLAWQLYVFASGYRRVVAREPVKRGALRKLRGRLLRLPRQFMVVSAIGWFPGIVLFPWLLGFFGQPPNAEQWFHFGVSFAIAGLIATTYSYAFVVYIVVCLGYRACWQTATHYRQRARYELSGMERRIFWVSILAGVLPLAAAVLLLAIGMPNDLQQMRSLHELLIALIVSGAIGLYVVQIAAGRLIRVVRALTLVDDEEGVAS
ncbi:MAG: bifunctional serine/threonine protein kinase/MFS transporter [Rubripirellula sp.]